MQFRIFDIVFFHVVRTFVWNIRLFIGDGWIWNIQIEYLQNIARDECVFGYILFIQYPKQNINK